MPSGLAKDCQTPGSGSCGWDEAKTRKGAEPRPKIVGLQQRRGGELNDLGHAAGWGQQNRKPWCPRLAPE